MNYKEIALDIIKRVEAGEFAEGNFLSRTGHVQVERALAKAEKIKANSSKCQSSKKKQLLSEAERMAKAIDEFGTTE